jgi:hypothetical protein
LLGNFCAIHAKRVIFMPELKPAFGHRQAWKNVKKVSFVNNQSFPWPHLVTKRLLIPANVFLNFDHSEIHWSFPYPYLASFEKAPLIDRLYL